MMFQLMLWLLGRRIAWLTEHNEPFRGAIAGRVCVIQFRTASGRVWQYCAFASGRTDSRRRLHAQPLMTFSFASSGSALALMSWFMVVSTHFGQSR